MLKINDQDHGEADPPGTAAAVEFFAAFFLAWTLFGLLNVYPGHVHYDTAEIAMWSALEPAFGYRKHPPLMPWLFGLVGLVVPLNWITLTILAGLNITLGAFAVWRIACLVLGAERAPVVMAIHLASPYATWLALKLDHNAILVSLWPLVIWAFLNVLRRPTTRNGAILGLACAAAMYAKYTSALLLVALAIAALADRRRMELLGSPAPWVAIAVAGLLLAPHALWAVANPVAAFGLVTQDVVSGSVFSIVARNAGLLLPAAAMAACLYLMGRAPLRNRQEIQAIAITVAVPYIAILLATAALHLRGSPAWAMPVFAVLPVLLAARTAPLPQQLQPAAAWAMRTLFVVIVLTAPFLLAHRFQDAEGTAAEPRHELAGEAIAAWRRATDLPLHIVAGEHRFAMAAHLVAPERPRVWSMFEEPTPWITPALVERHGMLALCVPGSELCRIVESYGAGGAWSCPVSAHRSWRGMTGATFTLVAVIVPPRDTIPARKDCPTRPQS